jgi:hypothetical protein
MGIIKMPSASNYMKDKQLRIYVPNFMICPSIDTILIPEQTIED